MASEPTKVGPPDSRAGPNSTRLYRFLRYSHIFCAIARETLDGRYLSEVTRGSLTLPQFHLLRLVSQDGHSHVGTIAECLGVSPPSISMNIDKLERLELASRHTDEADRRATLLEVSDRGREVVGDYDALVKDRVSAILADFEPEEIDQLNALLERIIASFLIAEPPTGKSCLRCAAYGAQPCPVDRVLQNCSYKRLRMPCCQAEATKEVTP
jgi:DNA-binding MarR family transcriptional regulator